MLKQSHMNNSGDYHHHLHLYDKVRQDLFDENKSHHQAKLLRAPSITTIFLLQVQAYIIQMLIHFPPVKENSNSTALSSSSQPSQRRPTFYLVYQQKRLHMITSIQSIVRQCLRYILLAILLILDNIARVLNVEREMYEMKAANQEQQHKEEKKPMLHNGSGGYHMNDDDEEEDEEDDEFIRSSTDTYRDDYYHLQKKSSFNHLHHHLHINQRSDQCATGNKRGGGIGNTTTTNGISSEPSSPTIQQHHQQKKTNGYPSPSHSPTPNFVRNCTNSVNASAGTTSRPSSTLIQQKEISSSPNLNPSRVYNHHRARSLSNNMIDNNNKQQKLRRITGQREITVQNAILPIPSKNNQKPPAKANSVTSSRSSSAEGARPKMQKTQSLSTAQQYHNSHHHHHHHSHSNGASNEVL